ncbi:MAG: hypothetical protein HZC41_00540 [Chloroflexi bacterium]|nr:hypothetical protein [Chloroflexota bacterium]
MRKLLALVLIVVVVAPLILVTLGFMAVDSWILDREFYVNALSNERLYQALLTDELPRQMNREVLTEVDSLPAGALSAALRTVVTPDYLRQQAVTNINSFFDYIEGRAPAPQLYLDVTPIKTQIAGEGRDSFARALAENLPVCTAGQEAVAPGGSVMRCRPADVTVGEAAAQIEDALPRLLETAPDRIPIGEGVDVQNANWLINLTLRSQLNQAIGALLLISFLAWLVAGLIAGNTWRERLFWMGGALLLPAIPAALVGGAFLSAQAVNAIDVNLSRSISYSPTFEQAIMDVVRPALNASGSSLLGLGAALTLVGLIFIISASRMEPAYHRQGPTVLVMPGGTKAKRDQA